jgi:hypothetical protein
MSPTLVWQILLAVAAAVISTFGPWATSWLVAHLKASKNTVLSQQLSTLVNLAGTMALDALQSVAAHNVTLNIKNAAVLKAIDALEEPFDALRVAFNLTPEHIASLVSGELTKLLGVATNADGTVVAAEPAPASGGGTGGTVTKTSFIGNTENFKGSRFFEDFKEARPGLLGGGIYRDRMRERRQHPIARLLSWLRRHLILAPLAGLAMLAACASTITTQLVTDAQIALTTLSGTLSDYEATTGANSAVVTQVQNYIAEAQKIITDYQNGVSTSFDVASVTTLVEDGVNVLSQVQSVAKATSGTVSTLPNDLAASQAALAKLKADQA